MSMCMGHVLVLYSKRYVCRKREAPRTKGLRGFSLKMLLINYLTTNLQVLP